MHPLVLSTILTFTCLNPDLLIASYRRINIFKNASEGQYLSALQPFDPALPGKQLRQKQILMTKVGCNVHFILTH
jgi:hypothetical protein